MWKYWKLLYTGQWLTPVQLFLWEEYLWCTILYLNMHLFVIEVVFYPQTFKHWTIHHHVSVFWFEILDHTEHWSREYGSLFNCNESYYHLLMIHVFWWFLHKFWRFYTLGVAWLWSGCSSLKRLNLLLTSLFYHHDFIHVFVSNTHPWIDSF